MRVISQSELFPRIFSSRWYSAALRYNSHTAPITKYMKIPINGNIVEIPLFAVSALNRVNDREYLNNIDTLVIPISPKPMVSCYSSKSRALTDCMCNSDSYPVKFEAEDTIYYVWKGSIFDVNLYPIMMSSWGYKVYENEGGVKFRAIKPVVRISPSHFRAHGNYVEKFISKKVPDLLFNHYHNIFIENRNNIFTEVSYGAYVPSLIIEYPPFEMGYANAPSINTTDEELRQLALQYTDDILL